MKDKKFTLLLVSALSIGQLFSMDLSELDDHLKDALGGNNKKPVESFDNLDLADNQSDAKKSINMPVAGSAKKGEKKKPIWGSTKTKNTTITGATEGLKLNLNFSLNIPGKDPFEVIIDNNNSLATGTNLVEHYLDDIVEVNKIARNFASNIQSYNNKIKAVEKNKDLYTPTFIESINTKYNSFLDSQKNMTTLVDAIEKDKKAVKDHVDNISKATGIFNSDYKTILSNLKDVNDKLPIIDKNYQKLQEALSEVSEALKLFDEEATVSKREVAALKAEKEAKDAEIKATNEAAALKAAQQKKDQEAIAAAAKAQQEAEEAKKQAIALEKQKEEEAAKAQAELALKKAEMEAMKIDSIISQINALRNRANDMVLASHALISDIEENADKYEDNYVNKVRARVESDILDLGNNFNQDIKKINAIIDEMKKIDQERTDFENQLAQGSSLQKMSEWFTGSKSQKVTELLNKYQEKYKVVSDLLKKSEQDYTKFVDIHNALVISALQAKVIDPKSAAAILELARSVHMHQVALMPRVLELAYAVRHK